MRITLYLLTASAKLDDSALKESSGFALLKSKPIKNTPTRLFTKTTPPYEAKWAKELRFLVEDDAGNAALDRIQSISSGALLLLQVNGRIFAIAFGGGFHAINPTLIERGFGIRVAANCVASSKLKSADTRALEGTGKSQKIILPAAAEMAELGVEPLEEWIRQLSGTVADESFARSVSGSDSLRLTITDFDLSKLPGKLLKIAEVYKQNIYKTSFGFLDNFTPLDKKDPKIAELDEQVAQRILKRFTDVYFAAPDPFEQLNVESYELVRNKRFPVEELAQEDVYGALDQMNLDIDDPLHKISVHALDDAGNELDKTYKLYDYIQAECDGIGNDRYVLSAGQWFCVSKSYVEQIDKQLKTITDITGELTLAPWQKKQDGKYETEGTYNKRIAKEAGFALLDKDNLSLGGYRKIEVCDLLTGDNDLVCVKRATRSSTLSHLFAQGSVSASLMYEPEYQQKLLDGREKITGQKQKWDPDAKWRIVYAIGTDKKGALLDSLFFFSRMNLVKHIHDIRSRGITVAVAKIDMP